MRARLGYDLHGSADDPVLVLGSSLGTTRRMWDAHLAALSGRFRVLRFDHLGHGDSEVPDGPYTLAGLGAEVLALLDELGLGRVHYAGLSLGGMVGMWLAAHAPERVDRLALLCTSAHLPPEEMWRARAHAVRTAGLAAVSDAALQRWFTPAWAATHPDEVAASRAMLLGVPAEGYAGCCEAIAEMDLRPDLPRITAPTLVVAGELDQSTPLPHAEQIVGAVRGARLAVVPGSGHLAAVQSPQACTALLLEHLGSAGPSTEPGGQP